MSVNIVLKIILELALSDISTSDVLRDLYFDMKYLLRYCLPHSLGYHVISYYIENVTSVTSVLSVYI